MNLQRRGLLGLAGLTPLLMLAREARPADGTATRTLLTDFQAGEPWILDGASWSGFSDRVMGGVSDGQAEVMDVAGRRALRLTGRVTRDSGGGFLQMAMDFGRGRAGFDASAWQGLELLVYGNDEDYNVHLRTADVRWYSQSYRATIHVARAWQTIRLPWSAFTPHEIDAPLDTRHLLRIGLLGWMREFQADLALAELALYA